MSEFGYTEQPDRREYPNPFCVCFSSPSAAVTVEGIQWGFGVQVILSHSLPAAYASCVPLWAVAELRRIPWDTVSGQLPQLARDAALLRLAAPDILRGDFSSFPEVMRIVEHHAAEAAKPKQRKLP